MKVFSWVEFPTRSFGRNCKYVLKHLCVFPDPSDDGGEGGEGDGVGQGGVEQHMGRGLLLLWLLL